MFRKIFGARRRIIHVDILTGYAHWAGHYLAQAHNPLMRIEEQAMLSLLPDPAGKTCLDLACGSGRYMIHLQARCAGLVVGFDYSAHMLAQAKTTNPAFRLIRSPFLALPFASNSFDLITCGLGVGHEKNLKGVLAEAGRVLRVGGAMIYSDFHPFLALSGARRTFTAANGAAFELEHYIHLYHHHQQACRAAGLVIDGVLEPQADEKVEASFQAIPIALVIRAIKTGDY
jgi:malonyl-CoA O-methyltransferase